MVQLVLDLKPWWPVATYLTVCGLALTVAYSGD